MRQINRLDGVPFILMAMNTGDKHREAETLKVLGLSNFVFCEGVYKGSKEDSFAVFFTSPEEYRTILSLAMRHHQESILVVDSNRDAQLNHLDSAEKVNLGRFVSVLKNEVVGLDNYTYVPSMDTYFVTKG